MDGARQSKARSAERALWVAFTRLPGVGARAAQRLLAEFGSIEAVFGASAQQLRRVLPDNDPAVAALVDGPDAQQLARDLEWLAQDGHHLLAWTDSDYPPLLREIPDPPVALYVVGEPAWLTRPQIAVVGARNPTPSGRDNARAFAQALSRAGLTITSGLALGIDAAAHLGALACGGSTVAVCGTGLDRVYPAAHRHLAHTIAERGALVSEFPLGTPPRAQNFPVRNRLISGLSLGVLVVEAAAQSGSLITARCALEQGREVFAIPGSIHSPLARGCHALIRQGAKLVETVEDVLEELGAIARHVVHSAPASPAAPAPPPGLAPELQGLLEHMGYDPVGVDVLVARSGLTADAVSSMLLQLELLGCVAACPGGRYVRTA